MVWERYGIQFQFRPWVNHGARPLGTLLWANEGEEDDWKQPKWIYQGEIMPDKPDCLLL